MAQTLYGGISRRCTGKKCRSETELVLEPAATVGLSALGELAPEVVDLLLGVAVHHEGDRERELELRTPIQGHEVLSIELEGDGHHRPLRARSGFAVSRDAHDLGILEDGSVELRGLLCLGVEPQERSDLLHVGVLLALGSFGFDAWTAAARENHRCIAQIVMKM